MSAKYDRQIDLLNLLLRGGRRTTASIAEELHVSVHAVKRDIADLQYHFPVFTYCGRKGGVELNNCYFINNRILKSGQVRVIRDALRCLARSKDEQATEARSVLFNVFHE